MRFTKAYGISTKGGKVGQGLAKSLNFGSEKTSLQVKPSLLGQWLFHVLHTEFGIPVLCKC